MHSYEIFMRAVYGRVLHGTSICHSGSRPGPARSSAVFYSTDNPVPAIPVCSGILPVAERHDAESGAVSRPIAAACNDIAAVPRDALLAVRRDYHRGHSSSRQSRRTTGSRRSPLPFPC